MAHQESKETPDRIVGKGTFTMPTKAVEDQPQRKCGGECSCGHNRGK